MNSVRLIIKLEILTCSNELDVKGGGECDNSKGMENTNPFSFYFAAEKVRQWGWQLWGAMS